eukprot:GHVN01015045.1.p1 GENE.GHVN01015045.1~~GHVN01015045.1.p1  ORF type:complete len:187 (+),score=35.48 GHVN01015045.1:3-563(+)
MLIDRGYIMSTVTMNETFDEFQKSLESVSGQRSKLLLIGGAKEKKIIVYFADELAKRVGVKPIQDLTEKMEERVIQRAILVTQLPLTPFAKEAVSEAAPKNIIESFLESDLLVNITRHELVPKHTPLSDAEKAALLSRYKIKETMLPRMMGDDPVARYYGLSKGQVVKIIRPSETAGRYVTYRYVY